MYSKFHTSAAGRPAMDSSKIQVLFLVDCARTTVQDDRQSRVRALCLSCTRILLYLSKFPNREHIKGVQWNCKFFSSQSPVPLKVRPKSTQFQDVTSDNLENFFTSMKECIDSTNVLSTAANRTLTPIQLLYNALAASAQDFPWDAPEIASPVRQISSRKRVTKALRRTVSSNPQTPKHNFIFICAQCPECKEEVVNFCGGSTNLKEVLQKRLFPAPLLAQLEAKGISLHWINYRDLESTGHKECSALSLMSELLAQTGGTLIPMATLIGPIHSTESPSSTEGVSAIHTSSMSNDQLHGVDSETQMEVDCEVTVATDEEKQLAFAPQVSETSEFDCNSEIQEEVKSSSVQRKSRNVPHILTTLFPSCSFLERYLRGQRSDRGPVELVTSSRGGNVYWLSTTAGKILCILDLNSMYNLKRGPSSQHLVGQKLPPSKQPDKRKPSPRQYSLTAQSSNNKSIKKKLSFSETTTKSQKSSKTGQNQNIKNPNTQKWSNCSTSPRIVIVGVIKQRGFPLSYLDPASSCSCTSVYVPHQVREQHTLTNPLSIKQHLHSQPSQKSPGDTSSTSDEVCRTPENITQPFLFKTPENSTSSIKTSLFKTSENVSVVSKVFKTPENSVKLDSFFSRSPQIHLSKLPFTPPSDRDRRILSKTRKRCQSAPVPTLGVSVLDVLQRTLTVDVQRCTTQLTEKSLQQRLRGQRSISMSPRYPVLKLRKVLEPVQAPYSVQNVEIPHPRDCLMKKHYHSKQFQTLCVWLAKNGYHLVTQVWTENGHSNMAILQPVSSLIATLTLVHPRHQTSLLSKLVRLEECETSAPTKPVSVYEDEQRSKVIISVNNSDVRSKVARDPELMASVSLLLTNKQGSEVAPLNYLPPFTNQSLLPWFPYTEQSGLSKGTVASLSYPDSDEHSIPHSMLDLVSNLRTAYLNRGPTLSSGASTVYQYTTVKDREGGVEGEETVKLDGASEQTNEPAAGPEDTVPTVSTLDELYGWFQQSYQEQIESDIEQDLKGDHFQKWVSSTVPKFADTFTTLVANVQSSNQITASDVQNQLWEVLNSRVLVSGHSLGGKYDNLFRGHHGDGGNKGEEDGEGTKDQEKVLADQRLSEYLLQVLLRFATVKACPGSLQDQTGYSDRLIFLLRKISLMSNPGLLGNLMRKIILPLYIEFCKPVLLEIYEGLMLPLPSDLNPDPDSEPESVGVVSQEEATPTSTEDGESVLSMEVLPVAKPLAPPHQNVKKLARHTSFQESTTQRQITVSKKKKRSKNKKEKSSWKRLNTEAPLPMKRRSPRLAKINGESDSGKGRTGVCRSLFSRSHSVCEGVASLKRRLSDDADHGHQTKRKKTGGFKRHPTMAEVLVKETPVKKQVENYQRFKLQRLRSKSNITSPDVVAIEESPKRSFYSKPRITRAPESDSTLFKTPPLKDGKSKSPAKLLLKKEPSPAALHSLLHGEILSPVSRTTPSQSHTPSHSHTLTTTPSHIHTPVKSYMTESPLKRAATAVSFRQSPEMFNGISDSPASLGISEASSMTSKTPSKVGTSNVIGRTPSKVGPSATNELPDGLFWASSGSKPAKTARMLTYDGENHLSVDLLASSSEDTNIGSIHSSTAEDHINPRDVGSIQADSHYSLNSACLTLQAPPIPPAEELTILDIPSLYAPSAPLTEEPELEEIPQLVSPPERQSNGCLLTDTIDPGIENESASMMAFALCTPTKEDRRDFHHAFAN